MGLPTASFRFLATIFTLVLLARAVLGAPTREQVEQISALRKEISRAGKLYLEDKFQESGDVIKQTQAELEKLAQGADRQMVNALTTAFKELERAHALLELEGVVLPPLKPLAADSPSKPGEPGAPGKISFAKQVAPILMAKCGRCHVNNARGMFSMANYAALMKGPPAGVVVFKGDAVGSRLIEVIESGDMPRGGLKVAAEELNTLKQWIAEGAAYDGPDPGAGLASLAPGAAPSELPMVEVKQATGKETVSFARDIAPVFVENCFGCHGAGTQLRGQFNLTTFQGLLRGGDSGAVLAPGMPAESLLVKKLLGTGGGQRMPAGGLPPLSADVMAKIETWIKEGAAFDGPNPQQNVRDVANLARAQMQTHDELSADRAKRAAENWRLGMPGINASTAQTKNFLLVGAMGEGALAEVGEAAEAVAPKVAKIFQVPASDPLIKGRMTLFLFSQRYDYSEFGKMVEERGLPPEQRGHWKFDIVDAYGAMIPARNDEYSLESLVGEQLAGVYVASLGASPRWFTEGSARAVAAKLAPVDPRIADWDQRLPSILAAMGKPDDFLTGQLAPGEADIVSYSFVSRLMKDGKRYNGLLAKMREGAPFDQAFVAAYGSTPPQAALVWARTAAQDAARTAKQRSRVQATSRDR